MTDGKRIEILKRLDEERRTLARDGLVLEHVPPVTRGSMRDGAHHWINYSALDERTADSVIERELEHYRKLGIKYEWKAYAHDRPSDLLERLKRHGFVIGDREAVLVYELA